MRLLASVRILSCAVGTLATSGCLGVSPWGGPTAMNAPNTTLVAPNPYATTSGAMPPGMNGAAAPLAAGTNAPLSSGGPPPPPTSITPQVASSFGGAAMLASLKRAKDSVADSLRIQSPVIPAADPVKLNNEPPDAAQAAADLHYHAGRVFENQNALEAAASHYRDALANRPDDVRLLISNARINDRLGKVTEAEALYRRAIELKPNDASCYNDLAMCQARYGQLDLALGTLQRAIRLEPANKLYRNNLALVLVDSGRTADAFENLVTAHGEAVAHYNLGYMLLERGAAAEAEGHFHRSLELNPQLAVAQQMLEELNARRFATQPSAPAPSLGRLPTPLPPTNVANGFRGVR